MRMNRRLGKKVVMRWGLCYITDMDGKRDYRVGAVSKAMPATCGGIDMKFGFSYIGLIFLMMLTVPNIFWTKNQPVDYAKYVINENKALLMLERAGEVSVTCIALIFRDFNLQAWSLRLFWLLAAAVLMILYEVYWIRYFKSAKTMKDFYSSLPGISAFI